MNTVSLPLNSKWSTAWAQAREVLSSMRFAIALLTVICIAAAIGTVLKQGEPLVSYVDAFGPFWTEVFGAMGLFRIYSASWFLVILFFLVVSTSLCVARNTPKILADLSTFKENIREQALSAFPHRAQGLLSMPLSTAADGVVRVLSQHGWQLKTQQRTGASGSMPGLMIAARRGRANKLGYIAAHSAIVLVCVGGLFDGDLIAKTQIWWSGLTPYRGGQVTDQHRLSPRNPAYRAQLFVAEGQRSSSAVLNLAQGTLLQPLPFEIELRKFIVDYYSTGMPKRFASEIVVHDSRDGSAHAATVEVNKPFVYDGVTIFQSSFEDGGSLVQLKPLPLARGASVDGSVLLSGVVGAGGQRLPMSLTPQGPLTLEITGLRVINVENLAEAEAGKTAAPDSDAAIATANAVDTRGVNLQALTRHLGTGARSAGDKKLTNIGPAVTYKLRDEAGQAREFQNFMAPVTLDGHATFMLGVRNTVGESFRFLRVPADQNMQLTSWWLLHQALGEPSLRREAARQFALHGAPLGRADLVEQLQVSAQRVLDLFAGPAAMRHSQAGEAPLGGFDALSAFVEKVVPAPEQERTSATLLRVLNGGLFELNNLARQRAGLAVLSADNEANMDFMTRAVIALSDAQNYHAPVVLMPDSFEQRQASVFQVTRTPGRNVVYLGCALLVLGVFTMLYVRERRVWVWLQTDEGRAGTALTVALSSTRQTLDADAEFERLRDTLLALSPDPDSDSAQAHQKDRSAS